ncbi:transcriptional regulator of NAD metabolism [Acetoanaerobium pronyense]|uniref:Transcriptional regulator of NAD metabolism n=1 Tax=Acetoanaerobium pronyense TaxID=1482736 RepID=A0ABS4KK45_9FIRM|nr:transcription repressor NadR [Acetoanaerobium pronyense]MBP2027496.1 transcriptional regulator of NAD metabolism [Acetoanaerobium pronyense]
MQTNLRRIEIEKRLKEAVKYISGSELAKEFDVSRQVIVQDIAILRAKGINIIATPQGYMISEENQNSYRKVIASKHGKLKELEEELNIIIDNGGKVLDVIVEHEVYGDIKVILNLSSRKEVKNLVKNLKKSTSKPLSQITDGIHFHTIEADSEEDMNDIIRNLKEKGYLIETE